MSDLESILSAIGQGEARSLYLVAGDRVLAEPAGMRIGEVLAKETGCEVEVTRRPTRLTTLLNDLRTFSLFAAAKVIVAIETAVLADHTAAADLLDEALEALPVQGTGESLSEAERRASGRLLQTLRLFQLDPQSGSSLEVVSRLPGWAMQGGQRFRSGGRSRRRGKKQVDEIKEQLAELLDLAREAGIEGWAETEVGELAEIARRGLPPGHALVLAESSVSEEHPLVTTLQDQRCYLAVGRVEAARGGGWQGIDLLARQLREETGVAIDRDALAELARRTIQRASTRRAAAQTVDADSTARFAAEYRKLAMMSPAAPIGLEVVQTAIEDRGDEDVWKVLDAIGEGKADEALYRIRRLLASAEDVTAERLSFFALLAAFAKQLTTVSEMLELTGVSRAETNFARFKSQIAPQLQEDLGGGRKNPIAGLHPFRLFRVYRAACRMPKRRLVDLPGRVLETELRLKGNSREPDAVLTSLVCDLAASS
jgi:DNA polymerase-3 subunit delta